MRLLILINNYKGRNSTNTDATFERVLKEFTTYTHLDVDVVVFSTLEIQAENIVNLVYSADLSYSFAYVPRQWLTENLCCLDHEYIMYMENDLIIPESAVINCIQNNEYVGSVSEYYISGFIRYENKGHKKKYIDMLPVDKPTVEKVLTAENGHTYWIPGNIHSGNFLLSRQQLDKMIANRSFQISHLQYGKQYYGILESAASDVYLDFIKVLPEDFKSVEIEHISNKYDGLSRKEISDTIDKVRLESYRP